MTYHTPALLSESVDGLDIRPDGVYADVTFGGGGHSREILKRLGPDGRLVALDQDADAASNVPNDNRLIFERGNFRFLRNYLAHNGFRKIDGILADLGVSSHHFDAADRGFTFRDDAPLDMRMNAAGRLTAAEVINRYSESRLREIFAQYGEVPNASRLAAAIVSARQTPIERSSQLIAAVEKCISRGAENKYLAKVFQALRIEVNDELSGLKALLEQSIELLHEGGRLAVITYHSLEDRLVKNFFRNGMFEGEAEKDIYGNVKVPFRQINNKVIVPSDGEIEANSRARSAKLRIGERIAEF